MLRYGISVEATKPFKDTSIDKRNQLALDWIQSSVDLEHMLMAFLANFMPIINKGYDPKEPRFELSQEKYDELSKALQKVCPELYRQLVEIRV